MGDIIKIHSRRGKPKLGDFVVVRPSAGIGYVSLDEVEAALVSQGMLNSTPPPGCYRVTNIYIDDQGRLQVMYEDDNEGTG